MPSSCSIFAFLPQRRGPAGSLGCGSSRVRSPRDITIESTAIVPPDNTQHKSQTRTSQFRILSPRITPLHQAIASTGGRGAAPAGDPTKGQTDESQTNHRRVRAVKCRSCTCADVEHDPGNGIPWRLWKAKLPPAPQIILSEDPYDS